MTRKQCFLLWGSPLSSASQWQYFASRQRCVCSACAYLCICRVKCILMFLFIGGLYQVSGPFLCPGDCNICDGHHHNHRAVVQICKFRMKGEEHCFHFNNIWLIWIFAVADLLASHALCCLVSHCLHYGEYFFFIFHDLSVTSSCHPWCAFLQSFFSCSCSSSWHTTHSFW